MKYWVVAAILFVNLIFQSALLPFANCRHTAGHPTVLVVCFGLLGGTGYGMFTGLSGGLLQDILYGSSIGLNALHYLIIGYLTGLLYERIYVDRFVALLLLLFSAAPSPGSADAGLSVFYQVCRTCELWVY